MNKGFDVYDDENITTVNARLAEEVTDRALQLMGTPSKQPRFLFLNYFDPHFPYHPPEEFARQFASSQAADPLNLSLEPAALQQRVGLYDANCRAYFSGVSHRQNQRSRSIEFCRNFGDCRQKSPRILHNRQRRKPLVHCLRHARRRPRQSRWDCRVCR